MAGDREGGLKAEQTMIVKLGEERYRQWRKEVGRLGGQRSVGDRSGFALKKPGKDGLTGPERARVAGRLGGAAPRRVKGNFYNKPNDNASVPENGV